MSGSRALAWTRRRWAQSLVLSITLTGVAAVALVGILAAAVVGRQIRDDALARARATSEILARSTFAPQLSANGTLTARGEERLDNQLAAAQAAEPGTSAVLRATDGRVIYSSAGAQPAAANVGRPGTRIVRTGPDRTVRTILPVRDRSSGRTLAYLQLDTPYAPVARDIRTRTKRLNVVLALAALALYLLMLPTLIRAGRAVRAQYDPRKIELARDVKRAIRHGELSLAYQPIVYSDSGGLRSVEALVRWTDPRRGPISPATFIPALEATPAIWDFTSYVFERAFEQCAEWCAEGLEISIAVNVSGAVMLDRRLIPELEQLAVRHRLPPSMIELEITEGALVQDPREAAKVLRAIAEFGLSVIAIDDFGTGYSSLARLHELPLNALKIDQSFVRRMAEDGQTGIVRSVIELAHALDMEVIAEGVEDGETAARLHELGAECLQGYHFSRPVPPADLIEWARGAEPVGS